MKLIINIINLNEKDCRHGWLDNFIGPLKTICLQELTGVIYEITACSECFIFYLKWAYAIAECLY